jgi:hypothetical protein
MLRLLKKKGHGSSPDANAWMMSYADMATILLAMFIVLSTFSKDQTGISLYRGTGSFKQATNSFGLPGLMPNSWEVVPLNESGPQHAIDAPDEWKKKDGQDPDAPTRVIDAEEEYFQHFLSEVGRAFPLTKLPRSAGRVTLDMHEPLSKDAPFLTDKHRPNILPLLALLRRGNYQLQIIVWAGMPAETALIRSANQAEAIVTALANDAELSPAERSRLVGVGQSWRYRDVRRPVLSVIVTKAE